MDGPLEPRLAANVGQEAVEAEAIVTPKSGLSSSEDRVSSGGKQGSSGRRNKSTTEGLGRVFLPCVIVAFITGVLLGTQLPLERIRRSFPFHTSPLREHKEQQLLLEAPPPPPSLARGPVQDEVAPGATEVDDATLSPASQLPPYDQWGLPFLHHFEQTLPPELKRGKEEIATLLRESCSSKPETSLFSHTIARKAASVLSAGTMDNLVGIAITLREVEPIKPNGEETTHAPRSVLIRGILSVGYPSIVMEVEDTETGNMYSMRMRVFSAAGVQSVIEEAKLLASAQRWADSEESIARQASCGIPAHLVAKQKGFAIPLFVGNLANMPKVTLHGGFYFFSRVQIFGRLHGEFRFGSLVTANLSMHAKEYMGRRLVQTVLKLQQALLSHNNLDWTSIYALPDGSFLLGGFDSCIPFGQAIGVHIRLSGKHVEPTLRIQENLYAESAVPQANSDLWSLGMLLYELFTGGSVPYTEDEADYAEHGLKMSKYLIDSEVDPVELVLELNEANCPPRWVQLILRLLHPVRGTRITAWGILMEFPDLTEHHLPR
ncbi:hypothetical protein, conserved [Eimeria maxima]|uniref:Protein kinase domain-containing protein n=1 Tax=Eimeria maxima TaxID=5804 RepID=U6M6I2_EIMMA|nr:hypothetical protein, conserved [Eimeria maxima]CDJ59621.1 hypothetical protein, conserved [Eimeria maxima]